MLDSCVKGCVIKPLVNPKPFFCCLELHIGHREFLFVGKDLMFC